MLKFKTSLKFSVVKLRTKGDLFMSLLKSRKAQRSLSSHNQNATNPYRAYISTILVSSLIGTYLDLWLVGKGSYSFPVRPFASIFSINILFTLCILPLLTFFMIYVFNQVNRLSRLLLSVCSSLIIAFIEHYSEKFGFFAPSDRWTHLYSIIGYLIFITLLWNLFKWFSKP